MCVPVLIQVGGKADDGGTRPPSSPSRYALGRRRQAHTTQPNATNKTNRRLKPNRSKPQKAVPTDRTLCDLMLPKYPFMYLVGLARVLGLDESVASVEDAFPSSVRRLVLRSHAKLHCAIDLATIREIVVSDENMVLKYSDFKNVAPHTVIYAHKTSIQKIARYKAFDFRPLEEDKGERLRLEEQRVRDFIASFTVKKGKIIRWTGEQSNIEIPEKLASAIGKEAFAENQTLKSVKLPNGIAEIGEGAFKIALPFGRSSFPRV